MADGGYSVTFTVVDQATAKLDAINKRITQLRAPVDRLHRSTQKFFDVSGLTKIADGFKGIESGVVGAASAMSKIIPIFGTLVGAASVAGMAKIVSQFNDWGIQIGRSAQGLNIGASRLHEFQNAARLAGSSAEEMTEALKELSRTSADAVLGRNPLAFARFDKAGIALRGTNGELRNATELLPDVVNYVNKFSAAQDREQVATELGGKRLADLVETFRMSGKPMSAFLKQARELGLINDKTPRQMLDDRNAVAALSIAFENLGYAITPVLNEALRPLIRDLTQWVQSNSPEIQQAVRRIANDFKEWYKSGGQDRLLDSLKKIGDILIFVANHAEAIAITFAVAWGIKAVAGIAALTLALNPLNVILLAMAASAFTAWELLRQGSGKPGTFTDPMNPGRFGDPSIPAMPGGAGAPPTPGGGGAGWRTPGAAEAPLPPVGVGPGGTGVPNYTGTRGYGMTMPPTAGGATGTNGRVSQVVDQMTALAGTRGEAVRQFLRDPNGVISRDPDLGLWCAAFTNAYLQHAGVPGTGSLMARSFAAWGEAIDAANVRKGDVLLNYNREHVGVATGRSRIGPSGQRELEEISSNSIVDGQLQNIPGLRWRSDVEVLRSRQLARAQEAEIAKAQQPAPAPAAPPGAQPAAAPQAKWRTQEEIDRGVRPGHGAGGQTPAPAAPVPAPAAPQPALPPITAPTWGGQTPAPAGKSAGLPDIRNIGKPGGPQGMAYIFGDKIPRPKLDAKGNILAYPPQTDAKGNIIGSPEWTPVKRPRAEAAPQEITGGTRPTKSSFDVTVTHKNPPIGATVRAESKGDGVNVGAVKTEWAEATAI